MLKKVPRLRVIKLRRSSGPHSELVYELKTSVASGGFGAGGLGACGFEVTSGGDEAGLKGG
ncbi:hypothetical protein TYRP_003341 [Tyrophagus putrescentiae]|nr:hypothetical protein TYRP_003341 [Tyrophagus putrescentiae]